MLSSSAAEPNNSKRQKVSHDILKTLLETWLRTEPPRVMQSLLGSGVRIRQDLYKLQQLFDQAGFRTSIVQSPRLAVSLYKDSCTLVHPNDDENTEWKQQQRDYLLTMLGMHPDQEEREIYFKSNFRERRCLEQFWLRLKTACPKAMKDPQVQDWLTKHTATLEDSDPSADLAFLMELILQADHRLRREQLNFELERIGWYHCTLANTLLQQFLAGYHSCVIKEVFFKTSQNLKYERITFYLYDPNTDVVKPSTNFVFLPDLPQALKTGPESEQTAPQEGCNKNGTNGIVQNMVMTFWSHLLRHGGYFASAKMKEQLSPALERYFLSGLRQNPNVPLKLNAHFEPSEPMSLYLWGKAGSGKSSFVRHVPAAIQAAVKAHADPEMLTRFVKQLLNKPYNDLCLELDLRPNNNDLSVMSIIQSRKCTMTQSKPGLVVIALEEMPKYVVCLEVHDPNQLEVCQLLCQRFGGRKSDFNKDKKAPRNSEKRGIGGDASLITVFTSNYDLKAPSREALQRLPMFQHLTIVQMSAIDGEDREKFAHAYFQQSISDRIPTSKSSLNIAIKILEIPLGHGDTRPLVRHLRMLAYYVSRIILNGRKGETNGNGDQCSATHFVSVIQKGSACHVSVSECSTLELRVGRMENLFPVQHEVFDIRSRRVMDRFRAKLKMSEDDTFALSTILDFWLGRALAPAVILSKKADFVEKLIGTVKETLQCEGVQCMSNIDASSYKMMKSLYDSRDTPNLRDDILKLGGGKQTVDGVGASTIVAIGLKCPSTDDQLCIREMIEDTPSMTAFSSDRSALYKSGLLFVVHVEGDLITPELQSRASLIV